MEVILIAFSLSSNSQGHELVVPIEPSQYTGSVHSLDWPQSPSSSSQTPHRRRHDI